MIVRIERWGGAWVGGAAAIILGVGATAEDADPCPAAAPPAFAQAADQPTRAEVDAAWAMLDAYTQAATVRITCLTEAIDSAAGEGKSWSHLADAVSRTDAQREAAWSAYDRLQNAWIDANAVRSGSGEVVRGPRPQNDR